MEPTVQAKINIISTNHANPNWAAGQMLEVIKENVKLANRTTQTILLKELIIKKIPLKDVTSIEVKQRWNGKGKKDVKLIEFLMKKKLRSSQKEEKAKRREARTAKSKLYGWSNETNVPQGWRVNRNSKMAKQFRILHRNVVCKVFKDNLERNKKKIKYLKGVRDNNNNTEDIGTIYGVNVGDDMLDDPEEKPANVWGNTAVTDEAKQVLNLGKKFRLYPKLDSIALKTEIEKGLTIIRWKEQGLDEGDKADDATECVEDHNVEAEIVDFAMTKATEMKYNRRLYAPDSATLKPESNLQQTREALEDIDDKYKAERADEKGNIRESNLSNEQVKGLRDLKEKTKEDSVIMPTDKTMGLSIESKESYQAAGEVHIKDDEKITEKTRKHIESEFNAIGKGMLRFLRVGAGKKHDDRIKEAILTENVMLPLLSLYGKDHKPDINIELGPKRRPVVGASEGPNARVSDLAAKVLNKAADAEGSKFECSSTEALQAKVEDLNKRLQEEAFNSEGHVDDRKVVIGSLDFKAWYPTMKVEVVYHLSISN